MLRQGESRRGVHTPPHLCITPPFPSRSYFLSKAFWGPGQCSLGEICFFCAYLSVFPLTGDLRGGGGGVCVPASSLVTLQGLPQASFLQEALPDTRLGLIAPLDSIPGLTPPDVRLPHSFTHSLSSQHLPGGPFGGPDNSN